MIDFTKEELEELIIWSLHLAGCNHNLVNKIQSMIDNYCEHEYRYSNEAHFKCKECGIRER